MIELGLTAPARTPETRSYTSAIVNAVEAAAGGQGGLAVATGAVEIAAMTWGRALALADVQPRSRRTAALTPSVLAMIGRALCRSGEITYVLDVGRGGQVRMLPASASYVVVGSGDRRTWIYTSTVDGPGSTQTVYRRRDGVAHLQYAVDPVRPWLGRPPWASAGLPAALLAGLERQLAGEAAGPSGYILATPDVGDKDRAEDDDEETDPLATLRGDLAAAAGRTVLAPSTEAGYGAGPSAAPQKEYTPSRFGFAAPEQAVEARRDVERTLLAACGVPPVLLNHAAPGTSMREAWRQMTVGTIEPLAVLVASQLSAALGVDVRLTMPRSADVATLARAVQSLTGAGLTVEQAREVVGL